MADPYEFRRSGLVGRLQAFSGAHWNTASDPSAELPIYLDWGECEFRFGICRVRQAATGASGAPHIRELLHTAWHSGRDVDIWDEKERPLLAGSPRPAARGLSRWLRHYAELATVRGDIQVGETRIGDELPWC